MAQEPNCVEVQAAAGMMRAASQSSLLKAQQRAGNGYRSSLVFAYRSFQLAPKSKPAADRLLGLIPNSEEQQMILITLGDGLCDAESLADIKSLALVRDGFAREAAAAVMLSPNFMPSFVRYSLVAVQDPHSDYAVRMGRVCRRDRMNFLNAVRELPDKDQAWLSGHIIDLNNCRVLAVPESDK